MSLIIVLILGGIIGWLGARLTGRQEGVIASILIGIVGAFIGSLIAQAVGGNTQSYMTASWSGIIWTLIGAIIFSAILNAVQHRSYHDRV